MPPLMLFPLEIALLSRKGCDFRLLLLVKSSVIQWVPVTKDPLKFLFPVLLNVHACVCVQLNICVGAFKGQRQLRVLHSAMPSTLLETMSLTGPQFTCQSLHDVSASSTQD